MKTKLYFILFFHLIFAGQNIEGFIYDINNNPISNASVSIPEISLYVISNQDGYFSINIDEEKAILSIAIDQRTFSYKEAGLERVIFKVLAEQDFSEELAVINAVSYTHLTLPTTPYV